MEGLLVSLEGPEGSGKTTQAKLLSEYLSNKGYNIILTHEPGGTSLGEKLREILLAPQGDDPSSWCEYFLYLADRAHHVEKVIRPALKEGKIIICDRFIDATTAYQGYGRGLDLDLIKELNLLTAQEILPDLTIILDIDPKVGLRKAIERKIELGLEDGDRLEQRGLNFHCRVREGYHKIAQEDPARVKLIWVDGSIEVIQARIIAYVDELLESKGLA